MLSSPAQQLSDMPKGNQLTDKMGNALAALENIQEKRTEVLKEFIKIENIINRLENPIERRLMQSRYLDGHRFETIAVKLNYSWRHTHRLHTKALQNLNI